MFERVKTHFKENKKLYIGIGVGLALAGISFAMMRYYNKTTIVGAKALYAAAVPDAVEEVASTDIVVSRLLEINGSVVNGPITQNVYTGHAGHPGFITRCLDTGEVFRTQAGAASFAGVSDRAFRDHLKGIYPHAGGYHFERVAA